MTAYPEPRVGRLVDHRYGKADVRLMRLDRTVKPHRLFEATLCITLEGSFAEAYAEGDNRRVLPTDSIKNTVYALARKNTFETGEHIALVLGRHFTRSRDPVDRATISVAEKPWQHHDGYAAAFVAGGEERLTAQVCVTASGLETVSSGIDGLGILKSSGSGFTDFDHDRYTLLKDTEDRILASRLEATWDYSQVDPIDFATARRRVRRALLDAFADHESRSMQHTLYWMAEAALRAEPSIERITLRMPNKHCLLARLEAIGLDNPNRIFVPTDEPSGVIEGTVERIAL